MGPEFTCIIPNSLALITHTREDRREAAVLGPKTARLGFAFTIPNSLALINHSREDRRKAAILGH
jgi:hypothetical protein